MFARLCHWPCRGFGPPQSLPGKGILGFSRSGTAFAVTAAMSEESTPPEDSPVAPLSAASSQKSDAWRKKNLPRAVRIGGIWVDLKGDTYRTTEIGQASGSQRHSYMRIYG